MSFFKCEKCAHPLSDQALTCSNCGDPDPLYNNERMEINKKQMEVAHKLTRTVGIFIFFAIMLIIGLIAMPSGAKIVGVPFQLVIMIICVPFYIKYKKQHDLLEKERDENYKKFMSLKAD